MSRTIDPFDELAAMFLSAPSPKEPHQPQREPVHANGAPDSCTESNGIESLVIGHLPVRAGLWLTPYADVIAREHGATALIRLDLDQPAIQLVRGPSEWSTAPMGESLAQAIEIVSGEVDTWMIRGPLGTGSAEQIDAMPSRLTILSSADEAAVVAAYQVIKELSQASDQTGRPLPQLGLAVMGADRHVAAGVVERLNRTTLSFLGADIRLRACLPRMDAAVKSTRFASFATSMPSMAEAISWIERARSTGEKPQISRPAIAGRIEPLIEIADRTHTVSPAPPPGRDLFTNTVNQSVATPTQAQPRTDRAIQHGPAHLSRAPDPDRPTVVQTPVSEPTLDTYIAGSSDAALSSRTPYVSAAGVQAIRLPPSPAMGLEPKVNGSAREPSCNGHPVALASFVPGLAALPVRCPDHERVEIAIDQEGRLHLLVRETTVTGTRDLRIVEAWVHSHRELIAMACPQHRFEFAKPAACHLFTDQPPALADLHKTGLCLHVLAPVTVNGQVGWYAAPLNAVRVGTTR